MYVAIYDNTYDSVEQYEMELHESQMGRSINSLFEVYYNSHIYIFDYEFM